MVLEPADTMPPPLRARYLESAVPIVFPEAAEMPESELHLELRTLLYQLLRRHLGAAATVGSDQFIYYDASNPREVLAPDVYVQLKPRTSKVRSWNVWERGAPDVAVEIIGDGDSGEPSWAVKLQRYNAVGVRELVYFDPAAAPDARLRVWDRVDGVLIERDVVGGSCTSLVLGLRWVVAGAEDTRIALRIAVGEHGIQLVPTAAEGHEAEAKARIAAEARIAELEAELRRRS